MEAAVAAVVEVSADLLKRVTALRDKADDEPVHWDSKVDKFDKRLEFVRRQRARGDESISVEEVRDVSLFEFYWKYAVYRGKLRRGNPAVCLQVTPGYSAECADVQRAWCTRRRSCTRLQSGRSSNSVPSTSESALDGSGGWVGLDGALKLQLLQDALTLARSSLMLGQNMHDTALEYMPVTPV